MSRIVVIPAFNEEDSIYSVVNSCISNCDKVIVINDCSTDQTEVNARRAGADVVSFSENRGYSYSLAVGIKIAYNLGANIILTIDADRVFKSSSVEP